MILSSKYKNSIGGSNYDNRTYYPNIRRSGHTKAENLPAQYGFNTDYASFVAQALFYKCHADAPYTYEEALGERKEIFG